MTLFLLRQYAMMSFSPLGNRIFPLLGILIPMVVLNAWLMSDTGAIWMGPVFSLLISAGISPRPSEYEASLPIPSKDLALAKLLFAFCISVVPVLLTILVILVKDWHAITPSAALTALLLSYLLALAPRLFRSSQVAGQPAEGLVAVLPLAALVGSLLFVSTPWVSLVVIALVTTVLTGFWWKTIPTVFQMAPRNARTVKFASGSRLPGPRPWWWLIFRQSMSKQRIFNCCFLFFIGYTGAWYAALSVIFSMTDLWNKTKWLTALPISHRKRLWMILLPGSMLPLFSAYLGTEVQIPGFNYGSSPRRGAPTTYKHEPKYFESDTRVNLAFWAKAKNNVVPAVTAPWGETAQPYTLRMLGSVYYNPYSTRLANSERFADWQYARLTTAVYGRPLRRAEYSTDAIFPRRVTQSPRMLILSFALCFLLIIYVNAAAAVPHWKGAWRDPRFAIWYSVILQLVPALLVAGTIAFGLSADTADVVIPMIQQKLLHLSEVLPDNVFAVLVICAIPVVAAYALLEWQFRNTEMAVPAAMPPQKA